MGKGRRRPRQLRLTELRREEATGLSIERRIQELQAVAPLAADKPEVASAPAENLWPKRRALLIINTKSGPNHDSILHVRDVVDLLATFGIRADVRVKLRKSQARKVARSAAKGGRHEIIIAAGGDGTVEAVASGLVGTRATLGILALGTYNNVATSLGIPSDIRLASALIACGASRQIDVGLVTAKYMKRPRTFLEIGSVGLGAVLGPLGQHLEKGRWSQAAEVLPVVLQMSPTPTRLVLDDGSSLTSNALLVTVCNSPRSAAGLELEPAARMDDGLLDVSIYEDMDQAALVAHFAPIPMDTGGGKIRRTRARSVEIHTARPMPVAIESKPVGVTPACFTMLPGALTVIVGDGRGLLNAAPHSILRASAAAAQTITPATEPPPERPQAALGTTLDTGARSLQLLVPAAGRTVEAVASARSIAIPIATAALGLAAAAALRPILKRLRG
jgi:diacylglycerol kinase (ATP)